MPKAKKLTIRDVLLEAVEVQVDIDTATLSIDKLNTEVTGTKASVAEHLMLTATVFKTDHERFNNAVKADMDWLKSKEAGADQVDKIPRCFVQAKSDIIGAMKAGIDTKDKSYHQLRDEKVEARKKDAEPTDSISFDTGSNLGDAVAGLISTLKDVPVEKEEQVINILESAALDIMVLLELVKEVPITQAQVVNH